jgi:hypothetical protein
VRLERRAIKLARAMARRPAASFPEAMRSDSALEAAYRFFNNKKVTPKAILSAHREETICRAAELGSALAIHDTTLCEFTGETQRRGLGPLRKRGKNPDQGFLGHVTLAVSADGRRDPLGALALSTLVRSAAKKPRGHARLQRQDNEADRWLEQVVEVESVTRERVNVIHVMDREGDSYALLSGMTDARFIVRAAHDRVVNLPAEAKPSARNKLKSVLNSAPIFLEREVILSKRRNKLIAAERIHPNRDKRPARLAVSAMAVKLSRPRYASTEAAYLTLNVVRVVEVDTPAGEKPVEWILLTNLPVQTAEQVAFIVDSYCARWLIEEFFKALKTGCNYEARQLESLHALVNAFALLTPIAWSMLRLRSLSRSPGDELVLTANQIQVLRAISPRPLPRRPTAGDVLHSVAAVGGHLRRNGDPGWLTLMRGLGELLIVEVGWNARGRSRRKSARNDQS